MQKQNGIKLNFLDLQIRLILNYADHERCALETDFGPLFLKPEAQILVQRRCLLCAKFPLNLYLQHLTYLMDFALMDSLLMGITVTL